MLKLCNLSTYEEDLKVFSHDGELLRTYLNEHKIDGLELLIDQPWVDSVIPPDLIKGVHLRYWSNWLDLWREDHAALKKQFGSEANLRKYYGGTGRDALVAGYRAEIEKAIAAGAEYAVFHVSNARLSELFTYQFRYTDADVINATIELFNAVVAGLHAGITILFENLWWPGLTLCDKQLTVKLLEKVTYPNVGIMLDTGHLMNTNRMLKTQQDGIDYIIKTLKNLGELKQAIKGIHLHHSLSGEYVLKTIQTKNIPTDKHQIMAHILNIDQHLPFEHADIRKVVNYINPKYLVYEFMFSSRDQLSQYLRVQNAALGLV